MLFLGEGKLNLDLFPKVITSFESFLGAGKFSLKFAGGSSVALVILSKKAK